MLRFSLRELLLLTVTIGIGLGWWVHVRRLQSEARELQSDLLTQADFAYGLHHCLTKLGCEIPEDSDPRCANGGPYTRVFVPEALQAPTGCISFTLTGPRSELKRTLDGEFSEKYRAALGR